MKLCSTELQQRGLLAKLSELGEKIDLLHDMAGVPQRDIPTIDELIEQAKSDATKRKLLQNTLAELEFTDTEIEYQ